MLGFLFALLAAGGWGVGSIFSRLGLRGIPTSLGNMLVGLSGIVTILLAMLLLEGDALLRMSLSGIAWFAMTGVINFALGRDLSLQAIERLGAARSSLVTAIYPLFAILLAVLFIGERLSVLVAAGTCCIIGGLWLVMSERASGDQ